jgi:hypothetical protein
VTQKTTHSLWRPVTPGHERNHKTHTHSLQQPMQGAAKKESPLAPAISQLLLSSSACSRIRGRLGDPPSKMALLRCFQIIHDPKMTRESRPFLTRPFTVSETISHQSIKETISGCGAQLTSKWFRVSPCWSHKQWQI